MRNHSERIIEEFDKTKIPYVAKGDGSLLDQSEIHDLLTLMYYVNAEDMHEPTTSYFRGKQLLESELLGLERTTIIALDSLEGENPINAFDNAQLSKKGVETDDKERLMKLYHLKKNLRRDKTKQLRLFFKILDATGYHHRLFRRFLQKGDPYAELKLRNLAKLSKLIHKFEEITNSRRFKSLWYHITSIPDNRMEDAATFDDTDAVKLMTIHQAKGLEFPVVIMAGVTARRYTTKSAEKPFLIDIPLELMLEQEEFERGEELRRTFYVGMSRAQKVLAISSIEGKRYKPSEFIECIGKDRCTEPSSFMGRLSDDDHYESPPQKTTLSFSSVNAYLNCPFWFYCRDILGFQTPISYFQMYGVIVHNCLKKIHLMMKENKILDITDVISIVDTYCKDDESRDEWRDELITTLHDYYRNTSNFIKEVLDVELPFSYIDANLVIKGQVDLVIRNTDDEIEIIDFKSRYKENLKKYNVDLQLRMYNVALQGNYDEQIKKISAYTIMDNTRTVYPNTKEDLSRAKDIVVEIAKSIDNKEFERNWNSPFCTTKTGKCEFYFICNNLEGEA